MTQQSLILNYDDTQKSIAIIDCHHNKTLKTFYATTATIFEVLDILVRSGEVSFEYLLSDAVETLDDVQDLNTALEDLTPERKTFLDNVQNVLDQLLDFQVGNRVMFNDKEYVIALFDFSAKPITALIKRDGAEFTVTLQSLSKAPEPTEAFNTATELPISHHSLTMSFLANNEANRKYTKNQKVYMKGKPQPYYFQSYINESYCTLARSTNSEDISFTVPLEDVYIPEITQEVITTGGSSSVYMTHVKNPTTLDDAYDAECNDLIESLGMTPAEANVFKAVWRTAKARQGKVKKANHNAVYDAEKCMFFSERMLIAANEAELSDEH